MIRRGIAVFIIVGRQAVELQSSDGASGMVRWFAGNRRVYAISVVCDVHEESLCLFLETERAKTERVILCRVVGEAV